MAIAQSRDPNADIAVREWQVPENRTINARFIEKRGNKILISRMSDGERLVYSLADLSTYDQQWVRYFVLMKDSAIDARIEIDQVLQNGVIASGWGYVGPVKVETVQRRASVPGTGLKTHTTETRTWHETHRSRESANLPDRFFVQCITEGLYDGQTINIRIWPRGTYSYQTVLGSSSTIRAYTSVMPEAPKSSN
jgi:hypothetical protein